MPDVSFVSWERFPGGKVPREPIPQLAPDLAVEILSKNNTKCEMQRKIKEYFGAGARLVWLIDPEARSVSVYSAPGKFIVLAENQALEGGDVLPGFTLGIHELFARADRQAPPR